MNTSIHISDDVIEKNNEDHLLFLLEDAINDAAQTKASAYYPEGSLLALFPSNADKEKARGEVIEKARETDYDNLVPHDCGLRPIFEKKDSLHRAFLAEAVARIGAHAHEIGRELLDGVVPTRILSLESEGADAHNGSRHTIVVKTDAGTFLYKPRTLKPDIVVKRLCDDLFGGLFCVPRALDYTDYGFSEFIENVDPADSDELDGYFEALGSFCALSYFLSLSDQHAENFLARGSRLAPIDLETMLASALKWMRSGSEESAVAPIWKGAVGEERFSYDMARSITSTGMLTCKQGNLFGTILAGTQHKIGPIDARREALDHKEHVVAGFERGYSTCLENKKRIREAILSLRDTRLRVLLESTMFYHLLLKRLFNAATWNSADGVETMRGSLHMAERAAFSEAILESEAQSVLKGDYPAFYFIPQDKCLYDCNGVIEADYLIECPLSTALERLEAFDERDMRFQSCLLAKAIDDMPLMTDAKPLPLEAPSDTLSYEAAMAEAARILELAYKDIVPGKDSLGGLWATPYGETCRSAMDFSLGEGYAGAGVFAAACIAADAGDEHQAERLLDICLHELSCHITALQDAPAQFTRRGVGLADGVGGVARALQLIWCYTQDQRVPALYAALLRTIEAADFEAMRGCNVYNGIAGLLLPLASDVRGLPAFTGIERLADTLIDRASTDSAGHRVWTEYDGVCGEVGYGKGTGGIGLALLRAWQATDCRRFWDACCDAIAYEDAHYSAEFGFWPLKVQTKRKKASPPGICRGVSGQAVVFTQAAQAGVPLAQRNIERARLCALALPPEPNDNLCCGSSAIVEGLLTLECHEEAGMLLHAQIERSEYLGNYITEDTLRTPYFNPGVLYGCLGVGYELLRYAHPQTIRSIFA